MRPRKPGRPERPLTADEIVDLALPVFASRGPDGVGMSELAAAADIRKASLYHHFDSKDALYRAVVERALAGMVEPIARAWAGQGGFAERLDRLGAAVVDALAARPLTARLLVRELIGGGPWLAAGGATGVQRTLELTAAFLEAGMDSGEVRRQNPRHLALSIASLHLLPFAAEAPAGRFVGGPLHRPKGRAARKAEVLAQVRRLCGA